MSYNMFAHESATVISTVISKPKDFSRSHGVTSTVKVVITGSAVALRSCKAHSKINRETENLTHGSPIKVVTPENFISKLGTLDYVNF